MTIQDITTDIQAVEVIGDEILTTIEGLDPAVALPAELADTVLKLVGQFASAALTAWSNASGQPITVETVQALLPNQAPLTPPTA